MNVARGGGPGMAAASGDQPSPAALRTLASRFDREIGGVYGYIAGALRQQAADREGRNPECPQER